MSQPYPLQIKERRGETLVAVVVGTVVLALAVAGLASILSSNSLLEAEYEKNLQIFLLERNTDAVLRKVPVEGVGTGQEFYLRKNIGEKRFEILSGIENEALRFINARGEFQSPIERGTYERTLIMEQPADSNGFLGQSVQIRIDESTPN